MAKIDIERNPGVAQAFRVQSIPAVYAMVDGQVADGFLGAQDEPTVREFVQRLRMRPHGHLTLVDDEYEPEQPAPYGFDVEGSPPDDGHSSESGLVGVTAEGHPVYYNVDRHEYVEVVPRGFAWGFKWGLVATGGLALLCVLVLLALGSAS